LYFFSLFCMTGPCLRIHCRLFLFLFLFFFVFLFMVMEGMQNVGCLPNGQCPTSFPAPNAMAATWNSSLVTEMATVIGREMRAYYNAYVAVPKRERERR
jgi:hypothetical protein